MFRMFANKPKTESNVYKQHLSRLQNAKSKVDTNIFKRAKQVQTVSIKREELYANQLPSANAKLPTPVKATKNERIPSPVVTKSKMANFRSRSKSLIENALGKMFRSGQTQDVAKTCANLRSKAHKKDGTKPASPRVSFKQETAVHNETTKANQLLTSGKANIVQMKDNAKPAMSQQPKPQDTDTSNVNENRVTLMQLSHGNNFEGSAFKIPETLIVPAVDPHVAILERERALVKVCPVNKKSLQQKHTPFFKQISPETIEYYRDLTCGMAVYQLEHMLRPKIYIDLAVVKSKQHPDAAERHERSRFVGRLIFQMFTEACPALVMEFLRSCFANKRENFKFNTVYPGLWIEANFMFKKHSLLQNSAMGSFNDKLLSHKMGMGILSIPKRCLNEVQKSSRIDFTLSFARLSVPHGERIAFGLLEDGFDKLTMLGKLTNSSSTRIAVSECGVLQF